MLLLNSRQIKIVLGTALLLLVPFIAMQFTSEVYWALPDFVVAALLLLVTGFGCEWVMRKVNSKHLRYALIVLVIVLFLLIWAELAVGIFGSPLAGD